MKKPIEVVSEGLGHPEGPYALPDGRVIFANTYASEVGVWDPSQGNGHLCPHRRRPERLHARLRRLRLPHPVPDGRGLGRRPRPGRRRSSARPPTGTVEVVVTEADGMKLNAPNDLTFGADGRLYFTDSGDWDPVNKPHLGLHLRRRAGRHVPRARGARVTSIRTGSSPSRTVRSSGSSRTRAGSSGARRTGRRPSSTSSPRVTFPTASRSTSTATSGSRRSAPAAST